MKGSDKVIWHLQWPRLKAGARAPQWGVGGGGLSWGMQCLIAVAARSQKRAFVPISLSLSNTFSKEGRGWKGPGAHGPRTCICSRIALVVAYFDRLATLHQVRRWLICSNRTQWCAYAPPINYPLTVQINKFVKKTEGAQIIYLHITHVLQVIKPETFCLQPAL